MVIIEDSGFGESSSNSEQVCVSIYAFGKGIV